LNEPECVGESSHTSRRDQLFKAFLLPLGIRDGLPLGIRDAKGLKGRSGAGEARLAGDLGLIHCGREKIRIGKSAQCFAPGAFMRGCKQNAVNVENRCFECLGLDGSLCRSFADGYLHVPCSVFAALSLHEHVCFHARVGRERGR
jgi:hypothetical protein